MKKTIIIVVAAIVLVLIAVGTFLILRGNEDGWICENEKWVKHGNPSTPKPVESCGTESTKKNDQPVVTPDEKNKPEPIGGQKDEHGCYIAAGYSWCEAKKKCLRSWEEDCPGDASGDISAKTEQTGMIEGSLGYPSEGIPEMKICAENIESKKMVCTTEKIKNKKYTYGIGYQLEVPAGTYWVFASLTNAPEGGSGFGNNYRAYYSEFVPCDLNVDCLSHAPMDVPVGANQTVSKIDPIDWYNN